MPGTRNAQINKTQSLISRNSELTKEGDRHVEIHKYNVEALLESRRGKLNFIWLPDPPLYHLPTVSVSILKPCYNHH